MKYYFIRLTECWCNGLLKMCPFHISKYIFGVQIHFKPKHIYKQKTTAENALKQIANFLLIYSEELRSQLDCYNYDSSLYTLVYLTHTRDPFYSSKRVAVSVPACGKYYSFGGQTGTTTCKRRRVYVRRSSRHRHESIIFTVRSKLRIYRRQKQASFYGRNQSANILLS